jgi:hypothetical protein
MEHAVDKVALTVGWQLKKTLFVLSAKRDQISIAVLGQNGCVATDMQIC